MKVSKNKKRKKNNKESRRETRKEIGNQSATNASKTRSFGQYLNQNGKLGKNLRDKRGGVTN